MTPISTHVDCCVLKDELDNFKTILTSLLNSRNNITDRDLITIDTKIAIIYDHFISDCYISHPDLTLLLNIATQFSKHLQNPLIANSYYNNFTQRFPTSFPDVKTLYINTLLQLLNKPTITNICDKKCKHVSKSPLNINININ